MKKRRQHKKEKLSTSDIATIVLAVIEVIRFIRELFLNSQ